MYRYVRRWDKNPTILPSNFIFCFAGIPVTRFFWTGCLEKLLRSKNVTLVNSADEGCLKVITCQLCILRKMMSVCEWGIWMFAFNPVICSSHCKAWQQFKRVYEHQLGIRIMVNISVSDKHIRFSNFHHKTWDLLLSKESKVYRDDVSPSILKWRKSRKFPVDWSAFDICCRVSQYSCWHKLS